MSDADTKSMKAAILDSRAIRARFKLRLAKINKRLPKAERLSIAELCHKSETSLHTWNTWGRPGKNYQLAKVRKIDAVLTEYENA